MKHPFRLILYLSVVVLAVLCVTRAGAASGKPRLALVIGEAGYRSGALPTSDNDAGLVAQALAESGFNVTAYADLSAVAIRRAFASFIADVRRAGPNAEVAVYLSGYGLQFDGRNYFVPVDANLSEDTDLPAQAVDLTDVFQGLDRLPLKARISFFDLARAHALLHEDSYLASGLTLDAPPPGSIEVFNTAPGTVTSPGQGDYGPFAAALAGLIISPKLGLDDMLRLLRLRVTALTSGVEVPFAQGHLERAFAFMSPAPAAAPKPATPPLASFAPSTAFWEAIGRDTLQDYAAFIVAYPGDPQAPRIATMLAARREALIWAQTCRTGTASAYWTYMRRYPRGPHFMDVRRLLAGIQAPLEPPPRFELYKDIAVPPPGAGELGLINRPFVFLDDQASAAIPPPASGLLPPELVTFYDRFPPLLPVDVNDLPLPFPIRANEVFEVGRISQPGGGAGMPIRVGQKIDKAGKLVLVQERPDHKQLSMATITGSPQASGTLSQTGPSGAVIWSATAASIHASRTFMQRGANHELLSTKVVQLEDDDHWTITFSGPDDKSVAVITLNDKGMIVPEKDGGALRFIPQPVLARPTVLQSVPAKASPMRVIPASPASHLLPSSSGISGPATGFGAPVPPDETSPPASLDEKSLAPFTVQEPNEPKVFETQSPRVPEPVQPVIAVPNGPASPRPPESPAVPSNPRP